MERAKLLTFLGIDTEEERQTIEDLYLQMIQHNIIRFMILKVDFTRPAAPKLTLEYPKDSTPLRHFLMGYDKAKRNESKRKFQASAAPGKDPLASDETHSDSTLVQLPLEIIQHILTELDSFSLCQLASTCKFFCTWITEQPKLWEIIIKQMSFNRWENCSWDKSFDDMAKLLPPNSSRYGIYLWEAQFKPQPLFVHWCPDTCGIREKLTSSTLKHLTKRLLCGENTIEIQASCFEEINEAIVKDTVQRCSAMFGTELNVPRNYEPLTQGTGAGWT
eukprot:TRINITY_DN4876_c0_g1_i1.p1 TRINITY_DN4876_c0_g1~~TRINITY_DN4876_c0_g1_i1.p1  ORF type:complete len:297 (+),score=50.23 TRINITY_DN4876_c0_g1_i1:65-892(+)